MLMGYMMGVAYIRSCKPNDKKWLKSLYLTVKDETNMPKPNERPARINKSRGTNSM
jgi:hypothetical protein